MQKRKDRFKGSLEMGICLLKIRLVLGDEVINFEYERFSISHVTARILIRERWKVIN
jgi:hypothetical protein